MFAYLIAFSSRLHAGLDRRSIQPVAIVSGWVLEIYFGEDARFAVPSAFL